MAIVKFSGIGAALISGRVGGSTFASGASGATVRKYTKPVNRQTQGTIDSRTTFGVTSAQWRFLTPVERGTWAAGRANFPRTNSVGDSIILPPNALFISMNREISSTLEVLKDTNGTPALPSELPSFVPLKTCPVPSVLDIETAPFISQSVVDGEITSIKLGGFSTPSETPSATWAIFVKASRLMSPSVDSPDSSAFRSLASFKITGQASEVYDLLPAMQANIAPGFFEGASAAVFFDIYTVSNTGSVVFISRVRELLDQYE